MAQLSVAIRCRICEEPLTFPDGQDSWGFIHTLSGYMLSHDKCEKLKQSMLLEQAAKTAAKKPGAKVGAKNANRSAKS